MLAATRLIVFLRGQDFRNFGVEIRLSLPSAYPCYLMGPLKEGIQQNLQAKHSLPADRGCPCRSCP